MSAPTTSTPFGTEYWDRAHEVDATLRVESAVYQAKWPITGMPVWVITRYADARAALTDDRLRKDAAGLTRIIQDQLAAMGEDTRISGMFSPHMIFADGQAHDRLRKLVAPRFRNIDRLRPQIEQISTDLLRALPRATPLDLICEYAAPLPITVISELLGVPLSDRAQFGTWSAALMDDRGPEAVAATQEMSNYFAELFVAKRAHPDDDLLSALVTATTHGQLSNEEAMATAFLLVVAGHETTTSLLGNAVRWLIQPHIWQQLGTDPMLIPTAIEAVLRYDSPVRIATHRFTTEPVTVGGVTIPKNAIVMVSLASPNRDVAHFGYDADVLNVHREQRHNGGGHLAFGHGIHYCLGASLARLQAEVALNHLTSRFPEARLAADPADLHRRHSPLANAFQSLPIIL